jgi:cell division protein FtsL
MKILLITKTKIPLICLSMILLSASACVHLKEYQKSRLNDSEMALGNRKVEKNEMNFQSYREAASGANAGKTGGGCGCN